jgi:hypothetical protein
VLNFRVASSAAKMIFSGASGEYGFWISVKPFARATAAKLV